MSGRKQPDLVVLAEQEADKAADYQRIAEMGANAAAEAAIGAQRKREHSLILEPLARLAAERSQQAAAKATESSKIVDDLSSTVREEFSEAGRYEVTDIPRVDQASSRACTSSEMAGASARRAISSAQQVAAILVGLEEEQAGKRSKGGPGGVLVAPARNVRSRSDHQPAVPAAAQATGARPIGKKPAAPPEKKGLFGKIIDALTE